MPYDCICVVPEAQLNAEAAQKAKWKSEVIPVSDLDLSIRQTLAPTNYEHPINTMQLPKFDPNAPGPEVETPGTQDRRILWTSYEQEAEAIPPPVGTSTAPTGYTPPASMVLGQSATQPLAVPPAPVSTPFLSAKHGRGLQAIRMFMKEQSCFDILPESFRLIVFDTKLLIKRAMNALTQNGVVSAPLFDSDDLKFAGMFTLVDIIHVIQYYYRTASTYDNAAYELESLTLGHLREIEAEIDVPPPATAFVHPDQSLFDACAALARTHARRLPLIDHDESTGRETMVSVLTQYRVLKFISINCVPDCSRLVDTIGALGIGTYVASYLPKSKHGQYSSTGSGARSRSQSIATNLQESPGSSKLHRSTFSLSGGSYPAEPSPESETPRRPSVASSMSGTSESGFSSQYAPLLVATPDTPVLTIVHQFSEHGISAVPIIDPATGKVVNLYEAVDVVDLVRVNAYQALDMTIGEALKSRGPDFPGVMTCSADDTVASILQFIRDRRAHRFVIVDENDQLIGMLCLSDILKHLVGTESLQGVAIRGLGFRNEEEGVAVFDSAAEEDDYDAEDSDSDISSDSDLSLDISIASPLSPNRKS